MWRLWLEPPCTPRCHITSLISRQGPRTCYSPGPDPSPGLHETAQRDRWQRSIPPGESPVELKEQSSIRELVRRTIWWRFHRAERDAASQDQDFLNKIFSLSYFVVSQPLAEFRRDFDQVEHRAENRWWESIPKLFRVSSMSAGTSLRASTEVHVSPWSQQPVSGLPTHRPVNRLPIQNQILPKNHFQNVDHHSTSFFLKDTFQNEHSLKKVFNLSSLLPASMLLGVILRSGWQS